MSKPMTTESLKDLLARIDILFEAAIESGMQATYEDGSETPNKALYEKTLKELRMHLSFIDGREEYIQALRDKVAELEPDALRWLAVIGCARVRALGSAGLEKEYTDGYAHIGLELWTHHEAESSDISIDWLSRFADKAVAAKGWDVEKPWKPSIGDKCSLSEKFCKKYGDWNPRDVYTITGLTLKQGKLDITITEPDGIGQTDGFELDDITRPFEPEELSEINGAVANRPKATI